jgi:hypothetical protein
MKKLDIDNELDKNVKITGMINSVFRQRETLS